MSIFLKKPKCLNRHTNVSRNRNAHHMKNCEDSIQAIQAKEWCKGRNGGQRMPAKDSCKQPITDRSTEGN